MVAALCGLWAWLSPWAWWVLCGLWWALAWAWHCFATAAAMGWALKTLRRNEA